MPAETIVEPIPAATFAVRLVTYFLASLRIDFFAPALPNEARPPVATNSAINGSMSNTTVPTLAGIVNPLSASSACSER